MSNRLDGALPQGHPQTELERRERHEALAGLLAAYIDGELPAETQAQIEAHLLGCERCRREVALHRAVATTLGQTQGPVASAAFQTRLRQAVAATDVPDAPVPGVAGSSPWRRAVPLALLGVLTLVLILWFGGGDTRRMPVSVSPGDATGNALVEVAANPLFDSLWVHYQQTAARDLPGRARDLETVRRAVGMPITPLAASVAQLSGAWTSTLDGELIGVLAYRWQNQLLVQYVISDAVLFRSAVVRNALAQQQLVAVQRGALGLLGWPQARGMTVLVAPTPWTALRPLQRAAD